MPRSTGTGLAPHGMPPATAGLSPSSTSLNRCPSGSVNDRPARPPRSCTPPCATPLSSSHPAHHSRASRPGTLSSVSETSPAPAWFGVILNCGQSKNVTSVPGLPNSSP